MSRPTWPATLPQRLQEQGYKETFPKTIIRTQMDAGPAKVRRRTSANVRLIEGTLILTSAQVEILDDFYNGSDSATETVGGSITFDWKHPRYPDGDDVEMRFVEPPDVAAIGGNYYSAALKLEIMP